ncbi:hypothetical protein CEXT_495101 [Caerostris extrusa]|uniref:Uncharacterized protein n=1 Tax=Caerostris extrusa TaxID=172846 RepID=A0AAV4S7J4_CAEEX|nr:hypothetical protein CEXT_495101 [Caerostris extrusa]
MERKIVSEKDTLKDRPAVVLRKLIVFDLTGGKNPTVNLRFDLDPHFRDPIQFLLPAGKVFINGDGLVMDFRPVC